MDPRLTEVSKFLSYVLRHRPADIDLTLDENGWASIAALIEKSQPRMSLTEETVRQAVAQNDKQRFSISADGRYIRANQGHSIDVDLQLAPKDPPPVLFHGTASRFWDAIKAEGLKPQKRHHVHLSTDVATARSVGQRYGKSLVLQVAAGAMHQQGHAFFLSENGVWLTDAVPPMFLEPLPPKATGSAPASKPPKSST